MEFISKEHTKEEITSLLHPLIRKWFEEKFESLTPPQSMAIPSIHRKENILVSSPTGSGKTITAFLSIINELYTLQVEGKLEDKIYCVYVSPLKALANDINKNLKTPLKEITELTKGSGEGMGPPPAIRVAVRSGDTSSYERSRMVKKPPHIFITTPESLALVLSTPKFREKFRDVQYLIIDEIHDVSDSKRGILLSLSVERLQRYVKGELTRIGLSATQAPIEEIGKFLVGYRKVKPGVEEGGGHDEESEGSKDDGGSWEVRPLKIVEVKKPKLLDIKVLSPVENMNKFNYEIINTKMYDLLPSLISSHKSTIIFTNTRSATETIVHALKKRGVENIAAHHGSLSKEIRIDVENKLKTGELKTVVTSTSLELGIDVGFVDLVCQIGSPKTVAKGIQRIGRAGHSMIAVSKGRLIVYEKDDLVECAVLSRFAKEGKIDRIFILKNCLDVLSQTLVGMSLEKKYDVDEAYEIVKSSYCYHDLSKEKFALVLKYASGSDIEGIYGKIWYDPTSGSFGKKRGSRLIYYTNIGTIPPESNYYVKLASTGYPVGQLSEKFVENLREGDIFILAGKTYQFLKTSGMEIFVKDAFGRKPTVPSWTGELLPRSYDLSVGIGEFRRMVENHFAQKEQSCEVEDQGERESPEYADTEMDEKRQVPEEGIPELEDDKPATSMNEFERSPPTVGEMVGEQHKNESVDFNRDMMLDYSLDIGSANTIIEYICDQMKFHERLPTDRHVVIEGYIDPKGLYNVIFHCCFGRRTNDALSRAYAYQISSKYNMNIRISLTDDNFLLTMERRINLNEIPTLLSPDDVEDIIRLAVKNTELFNQRFRHCATRGLMVLRSYKGKEISIERQQAKTTKIIESLEGFQDFPIIEETYNEILNDAMNITTAKDVLKKIISQEITVSFIPYNDVPSPFAHNIILMGVSDIVLMEDRSSLLRELHSKVLEKALDKGSIEAKFKPSLVSEHFKAKLPEINKKDDVLNVIGEVGGLHLFVHKGEYVANFSEHPDPLLRLWALQHICENNIVDVKAKDDIWVLREDYPDMRNIYARSVKLTAEEKKYYSEIKEFSKRFSDYLGQSSEFCKCDEHGHLILNRREFEHNPAARPYLDELSALQKEARRLFTKQNQKTLEKLHEAYLVYGCMLIDPFKLKQQETVIEDILGEDKGESLLRQHADKIFASLDKIYERIYLAPDMELASESRPFEESLNRIVSQYLKFYAPSIVEGISVALNIGKNLVYECLDNLEKNNVVTSGNFLPNLPPRQYIFIEDLLNLEAKTKGKYEIIPEDVATQYIYNNHFHRNDLHGIKDVLAYFGTISSRFDIYSHYPDFTATEWNELRKKGEVVAGRFLGGKVSNTIPDYLGIYLPIYQLERPDVFQEKILQVLEKRPASISTLVQKLGVDRNQLKAALSFLDKNLYIQRAFIETERIANDYAIIPRPKELEELKEELKEIQQGKEKEKAREVKEGEDLEKEETAREVKEGEKPIGAKEGEERKEPQKPMETIYLKGVTGRVGDGDDGFTQAGRERALNQLILLYLKANAPASFQLLRRMLRMYRREISHALESLESEGIIQQVYVIGQTKELRYIPSSLLEEIKNTKLETNKTRIVSLTDPYVYRFISEIRMRYGDGWFYPIIRDKRVIGIVNAWKRSDSLEIRELDVFEKFEDSEEFINELVDAVEQFFEYYKRTGTSILKVTRFFKKDIKDLGSVVRTVFRNREFRRIHSWFVKGNILGRTYEKRDLINYIMYRYNFVWPDIKASLGEFADEKLIPILKDKALDKNMKRVLAVVPPARKVSRAEILAVVGLPQETLDGLLKELEEMGYLTKSGQSYQKRERVTTISKETAEKELIKNKLKEFGILNISNLHKYLRGNFTLRGIKTVLETLGKEDKVEQGYFVRGDEKLYYILKGEDRQILRKTFRGNTVLGSDERLYKTIEPIIKTEFPMKNPGLIFERGKIVGAYLINEEQSSPRIIHIDIYEEGKKILEDHMRGKKLVFSEIELGK